MCIRGPNGLARSAVRELGNLGNVGNLLAALGLDKCKPRNRRNSDARAEEWPKGFPGFLGFPYSGSSDGPDLEGAPLVAGQIAEHQHDLIHLHGCIEQRLQPPSDSSSGYYPHGLTAGLFEGRLELNRANIGTPGIGCYFACLASSWPFGMQHIQHGGEATGLLLVSFAVEEQLAKTDLHRPAGPVQIDGKSPDMVDMLLRCMLDR